MQRLISLKFDRINGILKKLSSGVMISEEELEEIAKIPSLRIALYRALEAHGCEEVFPLEWYTEEKGAESYLVNWLEFPTELGRSPDEISLMQIVTLEINIQRYYVFKFRSSAPEWAQKFSWMLGVCGPYNDSSSPFDIPRRIFSRFNSVGRVTPDDEVKWVHEHISV